LSEKTIEYYKEVYQYFARFISPQSRCSEITASVVEDFIFYLKDKNKDIRATSINNYFRGIRAWFYKYKLVQ